MRQHLFELIRKEEMVLWAGAGLSMYAGYPSGKKLCELIYEGLSKQEKELVSSSLTLQDLTEEVFRLRGNNKNHLLRSLTEIFVDKPPLSTLYHDKLRSIPHFKTIITTNYDRLFEESFKSSAQVVIDDINVPFFDKNKTQIIKIHGDLAFPKSVIITKSDYNKFFERRTEDSVLWSVIKERVSTNNVLFLGYNLEDPNIAVVFDRISSVLGTHRKEFFLAAPNLPPHKVNNLITQGIQYVDVTAEELIQEMILNIKENIIDDLQKGRTSADTFRKFLANNDLLPELKVDNNRYRVSSLKGKDNKVYGKFSLTLKDDKALLSEFRDFVSGEKIGMFQVSGDDLLHAEFWYGELKFPDSEGIAKLEIRSNPKFTTSIDLKFDDEFEINNIPTKLFTSRSRMEIHLEFPNGLLKVNLDIRTLPDAKFKIDYVHGEMCTKVKDEIELFTLLNKLAKGEKFIIYPKGGEPFSKEVPPLTPFLAESKFLLDYFNLLSVVENLYKVRFQNFARSGITDESYEKLKLAVSRGRNEKITYEWDGEMQMEFINDDNGRKNAELLSASASPIVAVYQQEEVLELHGYKINLGFKKMELEQPYIHNIDQILDGKESIARVSSKNKKLVVSYLNELEK